LEFVRQLYLFAEALIQIFFIMNLKQLLLILCLLYFVADYIILEIAKDCFKLELDFIGLRFEFEAEILFTEEVRFIIG